MSPGEIKDIVIGTLTAYYDPDMQKSNNPFCAEGLREIIYLIDINEQGRTLYHHAGEY